MGIKSFTSIAAIAMLASCSLPVTQSEREPAVWDEPAPAYATADDLLDVWNDAPYCFTDCSRMWGPSEWKSRATAAGGAFTRTELRFANTFMSGFTVWEMDELCSSFWTMSDDDVAVISAANDLSPGAMVGALYAWCDS
jgi:hypothetical protein